MGCSPAICKLARDGAELGTAAGLANLNNTAQVQCLPDAQVWLEQLEFD